MFLGVFGCFWVFLSVFEPKKHNFELFGRAFRRGLAKKTGDWSFFGSKTWSQIILGTIAELLAVLWSINDVCEAQKTCFSDAKTAFTMSFEIFKRSYLKIFI